MHASKISVATLAALIAFAAFAETAHADPCPPDFTPYIDVQWTTSRTGIVPVRQPAVMVAIESDCNDRFAVPATELRVAASRTLAGKFRPVAIERRGKLFAWRPPGPGVWFLRVGRSSESSESSDDRSPMDGGAIVVVYEPVDQVRARFEISRGGPRSGDGVVLQPVLDLEADDGPSARVIWREPFLFLPYPAAGLTVAKQLPRGRYLAREGVPENDSADEARGAPRRVDFFARSDAKRGTVEITSSGDVPLELHRVCKIPRRRPSP